MNGILTALVISAFLLTGPAFGADEHSGHGDGHKAEAGVQATHVGHGKVVSVDGVAGTIRIAHEPISSLRWPKMTMSFQAHDAAILKGIEPKMEVNFELVKMGDGFHITKISQSN